MKKIIYTIIAIMQIAIIVGSFIIQYLTNIKAGVMHHVYFKRYVFENGIFSNSNIKIESNILIVISLILLIFSIYIFLNKKNMKFLKIQLLIAIVVALSLYIIINSNYFISKLAYHYFIIAFASTLGIQIIIIFLNYVSNLIKNKI
ncbi:hypothetical protein [Paraclostridium bifermentans]|uniref:hypothetical protein n=1 Tax=Paraclostridium bifermentans TaxID=1490 RepID=UPI0018AC116B|nr:hypothetical protein [Paraclostridium bifermentans]